MNSGRRRPWTVARISSFSASGASIIKIHSGRSSPVLRVSHWNSFFSALIYLRDEAQYPLQLVLRNILIQNEVQELMNLDLGASNSLSESIKYGVIIVASIPVLILYPMVQKYFVKGVMIGSLKG